jgi:hypothetical protein
LHRGADVASVGFGHRLDGNRRIPAHFQLAQLNLSSLAAVNHRFTIEN